MEHLNVCNKGNTSVLMDINLTSLLLTLSETMSDQFEKLTFLYVLECWIFQINELLVCQRHHSNIFIATFE